MKDSLLYVTYGNKQKCIEEMEKIKCLDLKQLWDKFNELKKQKEVNDETMENTKSDMCYWGCVATGEELLCLLNFTEKVLVELIAEIIPRVYKLLETEDHYKDLKNRIKEEKDNLNKYKPHNYKAMVRLLEDL